MQEVTQLGILVLIGREKRMNSPLVQQLAGSIPFLLIGIGVSNLLPKSRSKSRLYSILAALFLLTAVKIVRVHDSMAFQLLSEMMSFPGL